MPKLNSDPAVPETKEFWERVHCIDVETRTTPTDVRVLIESLPAGAQTYYFNDMPEFVELYNRVPVNQSRTEVWLNQKCIGGFLRPEDWDMILLEMALDKLWVNNG